MVTAIVLIQTRHGRTKDVAEALAEFPEISEVYRSEERRVGKECRL